MKLNFALLSLQKTYATLSTNQKRKLKQITIWSPAFSRTLGNCLALTLSFEFSLALKDIFLQFKFWFNDTQPKSTPYRIIQTCNSLKLKSSNLYQ